MKKTKTTSKIYIEQNEINHPQRKKKNSVKKS